MTHISNSEISESLNRSRIARLLSNDKKKVFKRSLLEFIQYGLKYVFLGEPGAVVKGVATSHSVYPLKDLITSGNDPGYVWPYSQGRSRGMSLTPLYKTIPEIAYDNQDFYELLCLIDAIRVGKSREVKFALIELEKRIIADDSSLTDIRPG